MNQGSFRTGTGGDSEAKSMPHNFSSSAESELPALLLPVDEQAGTCSHIGHNAYDTVMFRAMAK